MAACSVSIPSSAVSIVEDLLERTDHFSATSRHFEVLAYLKQCSFLAPYNAFLVMQQRRSPSLVMTAEQWKRYGREPRSDVQPIVILKHFGPVSFVYDLADTYGDQLAGIPPNIPTHELIRRIFPTDGWFPGIEERYKRLVDAIKSQGVFFTEVPLKPELSGKVRLLRPLDFEVNKRRPLESYAIEINECHPVEVKLSGLVHELAHIYCNHLGTERLLEEKELEAEAVSYVFCYRRGFRPRSEEYLAEYLKYKIEIPVGFWERVLYAIKQIDRHDELVDEKDGCKPSEFKVYVGGYMGNSYSVELENGLLVYESMGRGYELLQRKEVKASSRSWAAFWKSCNKFCVWGWLPEYPNPGICGGTQWDIVIKTQYRELNSHGDNAYPEGSRGYDENSYEFNGFLRAVSRLLGGEKFE